MTFLAKILPVLSVCVILTAFIQVIRWREEAQILSKGDQPGRDERALELNTQTTTSRIIHVVSPFASSPCEEPFCPFDQTRSVVIASMIRAKVKSRSPVTLAAAIFPEDRFAIPPEFMLLPSLKRDTLSEYPSVPYMKKMPFLQDIFDLVLTSPIEYDYVVYTNSDIVLHEDFYNIVQEQINLGYDAFTINRQIINTEGRNGSKYTSLDLDEIFNLNGRKHPGFDCFIIKKEIFNQLNMGNVYVGSPPVARALLLQLELKALSVEMFPSNHLKATYHLGADRTVSVRKINNLVKQNTINTFCTMPDLIDECITSDHRHCQGLLRVIRGGWDKRITFESRDYWCKGKFKPQPLEELA